MEYIVTVTEQELGVIARALMERPYREVAALFGKLDAQIAEQQNPPAEVEAAPAE
jgi:hypothetical protein